MQTMGLAELREDFEFITSWEERFEYIIDLGRDLPPFPDRAKTEENRVKGCMSQVWVLVSWEGSAPERTLRIQAASDSSIVRGLAAVLLMLYNGLRESQQPEISARELFEELGLSEHLSPSRRTGLAALEQTIQRFMEQSS